MTAAQKLARQRVLPGVAYLVLRKEEKEDRGTSRKWQTKLDEEKGCVREPRRGPSFVAVHPEPA